MYGGKNSERIPIYRVYNRIEKLLPLETTATATDGFDTGGYTIYTYTHDAAHILYTYIYKCDWKKSRTQRKRKKTVSMSFQTSNRQHYKGISTCYGGRRRDESAERERERECERRLNLVSGKGGERKE